MKPELNQTPSAPVEPSAPGGGPFVAPGARPATLLPIELHLIDPFQRALLVNDGTVTRLIEAHTLEPVRVTCLEYTCFTLDQDDPWLEAPRGTPMVRRRVILEGAHSGTPYVYAEALIVAQRLPGEARRRLRIQGQSMGRILSETKMETRREILWCGREGADKLPDAARRLAEVEVLTRAYRIMFAGHAVALITERFPRPFPSPPSAG